VKQEGPGGLPSSRGPAPPCRPSRPSSDRPERADQVAPPESADKTPVNWPEPTGTQEDAVGPYVPGRSRARTWRKEDVRVKTGPLSVRPGAETSAGPSPAPPTDRPSIDLKVANVA